VLLNIILKMILWFPISQHGLEPKTKFYFGVKLMWKGINRWKRKL